MKNFKTIAMIAGLSVGLSGLTDISSYAQVSSKPASKKSSSKKSKSVNGAAAKTPAPEPVAEEKTPPPSSSNDSGASSGRLLKFLPEFLYLAGSGNLGWTYQPTADWQTMPVLFHGGADLDVAYRLMIVQLPQLAVGLNHSIDFVNQYSEPTYGVGNRRGMRLNLVSPSVYYFLNSNFMFAGNFRWWGSYYLFQATPTGLQASYSGVLGFRARGFYTGLPWFDVGLGAEYAQYSELDVGDIGSRRLSDALNHWLVSLIVQRRF